jgi:short-subunit dehydrogenase
MNAVINHSTLGIAVVTGASSGIGKMYAQRLAARGYDLLLIARRADRLKTVAADLESRFRIQVETLAVDLAQQAGLSEAIEKIASNASITLLVNNAGTSVFGPSAQASQEVLTRIVALNVTALTSLTNAVLPRFQERGSGTIINIGSVVGFAGYPLTPIYGGTKAYVLNFTQALQQQLAGTGIRIQLVTPASTVSEIWGTMGVDISDLDPATVMSTEDCVDAAMSGLDSGELITAPSVHDETLLRTFETASLALLAATQNGEPAPRYRAAIGK